MLTSLLLTAFLMGLGGVPHCTAMCGAACSMAFARGLPVTAWLGRLMGYSLLGAVAAVSAAAVSRWGREVAMLKPLWMMAQVAVVMLGIYVLMAGRLPAALDSLGRTAYDGLRARMGKLPLHMPPPWRGLWQFGWPLLGGMAWALMPCGLLYAALMVAALAPGAWGGALVMAAFALPSSVGVWAAPWVLGRLHAWQQRSAASGTATLKQKATFDSTEAVPVIWFKPEPDVSAPMGLEVNAKVLEATRPGGPLVDPSWALRASGLSLALMGAWAVWHQLVAQWQAWCA